MIAIALPAAFGAGVITSVGPCAAPRAIAVAALAQRSSRPWLTAAIFALGTIGGYVAIGFGSGLFASARHWSSAIDALLAVVLAAGGIATLLRDAPDRCTHRAVPRGGGIAALGAASALVVSPCCAPILAAIAGSAALAARPLDAAFVLAAFAAGHVLPLGTLAALGMQTTRWGPLRHVGHANAVISGSLMLALACYYGMLA
jgi:cytochrome c biogenesis protein CcdA